MFRFRLSFAVLSCVAAGLLAESRGGDAERGYQAAIQEYRRDEERLPRLTHYQGSTAGANGESVRREAWATVDGILVKTSEERRGPKGSELIETSMGDGFPYFIFRQTQVLLPGGSMRVEEERKYRNDGQLVRWTRRSATFPPGAEIVMKPVKQQTMPLANLGPDDTRTDRPTDAAVAIYDALRATAKPENDPAAGAGPDWQRIKLVKTTASPDGHYQLAWAPNGDKINWATYKQEGGDFNAESDTDVTNYIFDLKTMRIAGKTLGRHFGTRERYNHHDVLMAWSPDARIFVEVNAEKWQYSGCCVGRMVDGQVAACVEFGKLAEKQAAAFLVAQKDRPWRKNGGSMVINLDSPTAANDGTIAINVLGQVPKSTDEDVYVNVRVRFRVGGSGENLELTPLGAAYVKE